MKKRGVSDIIVSVLIIFLIVVAVMILYGILNGLVNENTLKIDQNTKKFTDSVARGGIEPLGGTGGGEGCTPDCSGKTCGDDSCGGSCGNCGVLQKCDSFQCKDIVDCFDSTLDPIPVCTCQDLQKISEKQDGKYELKNDIDCSMTRGWNNDLGFLPIKKFTGTLEGKGHVIEQLFINRSNEYPVGFIGINNGELNNLILRNIDVTGRHNVGGIVGDNFGKIINSSSAGNISCNKSVIAWRFSPLAYGAGLVAGLNRGKISNSSANGNSYCFGGAGVLVGSNEQGSLIENSFCKGKVSGTYNIGGLSGFNQGTITNSYTRSDVKGITYIEWKSQGVGGFCGSNYGDINNCYSVSSVKADSRAGGFVGVNTYKSISNSFSAGNVNGNDLIGGFAGEIQKYTESIMNSFATTNVSAETSIGGFAGNIEVGSMVVTGADGKKTIKKFNADIKNSFWSNDIDLYTPIQIENLDISKISQLGYFFNKNNKPFTSWDFVNTWKENPGNYPVLQWCNPSCAGKQCGDNGCGGDCSPGCAEPHGDNKCVDNQCVPDCSDKWGNCDSNDQNGCETNLYSNENCGECGHVCSEGKTCVQGHCSIPISDCSMLNDIRGDKEENYFLTEDIDCFDSRFWNNNLGFDPIGGATNNFSGRLYGENHAIKNLFINKSGSMLAGLFSSIGVDGHIEDLTLTNMVIFNADSNSGGLVGNNSGEIRNCSIINITINSSTMNKNIGGLAGRNYGRIYHAHVTGTLIGLEDIGGVVGNNYGRIEDSFSDVNISANNPTIEYLDMGGFVGHNNNQGFITDCHSNGNINGSNMISDVGGFAGHNQGVIKDSYSEANVYGYENIGGFVGESENMTYNCFAISKNVTGVKKPGGFVGKLTKGVVNYSYAISDVSGPVGVVNIGGFVGKLDNDGIISNSFYAIERAHISPKDNGIGQESISNLKNKDWLISKEWNFPPWVETEDVPELDWME